MNTFVVILLLTLAAAGHVVLWVGIVNRVHGVAWNRKLIDALTALCGVALVATPVAVAACFWNRGAVGFGPPWDAALATCWTWIGLNAIVAIVALVEELRRSWHPASHDRQGCRSMLANHTHELDVRKLVDEPLTAAGIPRVLGGLPYNQVVRPSFHEKQIVLPRLAVTVDGVKIAHITDLHMSGRIARRYFEEVFDRLNEWQPDIVAITGDIVERAKCLDWIPSTLGRLEAASGVYFVLGNHDQRVDSRRLRGELTSAGLVDVGSCWREVHVGDVPIIVAGNELPWYSPPANVAKAPGHNADGLPLRVLLSHSPDQFGWAAEREFDLVLAGHCHGGQVRFPLVGAVLAPSLHGTRYAAGVFRRDDTVMHVSRGVSGLAPFRFNCPPEVSQLVLRGALGYAASG